MSKQTEALRLAALIEKYDPDAAEAQELRRQHNLIEEMAGALNAFRTANGANDFNGWHSGFDEAIIKARTALAKWKESE